MYVYIYRHTHSLSIYIYILYIYMQATCSWLQTIPCQAQALPGEVVNLPAKGAGALGPFKGLLSKGSLKGVHKGSVILDGICEGCMIGF